MSLAAVGSVAQGGFRQGGLGFTPENTPEFAALTFHRAEHDDAMVSLALVMVWGGPSGVASGVFKRLKSIKKIELNSNT